MRLLQSVFLIGLLLFASCASLMTGPTDSIDIESNPPGATFTTNLGIQGTTPATITVPDDKTVMLTVSAPGYQTATVTLQPRMSGWFLGNLVFGGIVGIIIDLISGNWRVHDDEVNVQLAPIDGGNTSLN